MQDHDRMIISAGAGVAVREFPLKTGFADYIPHAEGEAIPEPSRRVNLDACLLRQQCARSVVVFANSPPCS